jgi:hypothetical protein
MRYTLLRLMVKLGQHGKATRHAHFVYLHYIPYNDYTDSEPKEE